ncbi:hypothetical protein K6W38_11460 [Burkholderia contaminans]|nr:MULTISPECIES: hypothetical protein [Burkholderia]MBY4723745.1 hypothetical protein [Burkholderia contaminans]MCI3968705.1 hypothetical protein [Burkholderia sp. HI4860]
MPGAMPGMKMNARRPTRFHVDAARSVVVRCVGADDAIEKFLRTRQLVERAIEARHRACVFGRRNVVVAFAAHGAKRLIDIARGFDEALRGPGFPRTDVGRHRHFSLRVAV